MASEYTPGVVTELLGYAFDEQRGWGYRLGDGERPEPGMPVGAYDPSKSGGLWAMTADVQRALRALPVKERRRVWLRYVEDKTAVWIAQREGVSSQAVDKSLLAGVQNMCRFLNGPDWVPAVKAA